MISLAVLVRSGGRLEQMTVVVQTVRGFNVRYETVQNSLTVAPICR